MAMDLSSDYTGETGIQIDWTYDDPDEATNLGDCWKKASQFAAHQQVSFTANGNCEVIVDESNLIRPYYGECDEGVYPKEVRLAGLSRPKGEFECQQPRQ